MNSLLIFIVIISVTVAQRRIIDVRPPPYTEFPSIFSEVRSVKMAMAYEIKFVRGRAQIQYDVVNQDGNKPSFQVFLFNASNYNMWYDGRSDYVCLNGDQCRSQNELPKSYLWSNTVYDFESFFIVVQNGNGINITKTALLNVQYIASFFGPTTTTNTRTTTDTRPTSTITTDTRPTTDTRTTTTNTGPTSTTTNTGPTSTNTHPTSTNTGPTSTNTNPTSTITTNTRTTTDTRSSSRSYTDTRSSSDSPSPSTATRSSSDSPSPSTATRPSSSSPSPSTATRPSSSSPSTATRPSVSRPSDTR